MHLIAFAAPDCRGSGSAPIAKHAKRTSLILSQAYGPGIGASRSNIISCYGKVQLHALNLL